MPVTRTSLVLKIFRRSGGHNTHSPSRRWNFKRLQEQSCVPENMVYNLTGRINNTESHYVFNKGDFRKVFGSGVSQRQDTDRCRALEIVVARLAQL